MLSQDRMLRPEPYAIASPVSTGNFSNLLRHKGIINIKDYHKKYGGSSNQKIKTTSKITIISSYAAHILQNPEYIGGRNHTIA